MKKAHYFIILLILLIQPVSVSADEVKKGAIPGRYIVKLKPGIKGATLTKSLGQAESLNKFRASAKLSSKHSFDDYYLFTSTDSNSSLSDVIVSLGRENIASIEPDYHLEFFDLPTDGYFPHQWYLNNEGQEYWGIYRNDGPYNDELLLKSGTIGKDVKLGTYYANSQASIKSIIVAIVDSGVDILHPELTGQLWVNEDEIPSNGIDDDHNGYVDDTIGFDISGDIISFLDPIPDNDPTDQNGHGTHIAGIVSAKRDGVGVVGVAPEAKIMAVKIRPNATTSVGVEGIIYAVNAGANIINLSWGTPFESGLLREALDYARDNNVLVCIAAGNSGDTTRYYPAAFDSSFVVAASNSDGYLTYFTTFGSHIDIAAPGEDILSLRADGTDLYDDVEPGLRIIDPDSLLILADGTSMSAPIVAGAAALLWSHNPELTVAQIENLLLMGADDLVDPFNNGDTLIGVDSLSGYGTLNIDNSFSLIANGGLFLSSPVNRQRYTGAIEIKAFPVNNYNNYWKLEFSLNTQSWELLAEGNSVPSDSVLFVFDRPDLNGEICFKLTDLSGSEVKSTIIYVNSNVISIDTPIGGVSVKYNVDITGSAYGLDYDSLVIEYINGASPNKIISTTREYFDELIYSWPISGVTAGTYKLRLTGYYGVDTISDSVNINIESAFALGWPRRLGTYGSITPVVTDLNRDGQKEIAIGCGRGLHLLHPDGSVVDGFPVLIDKDMRSVPVIYDIDNDNQDEIIITNTDGLNAFNYDGSTVTGWPINTITGNTPYGFGYPYPTVTQLGYGEDSAVVFINRLGQISAYEFNGDSYFYSMSGYFGSFAPRISGGFGYGGSTGAQITSTDFNNDGLYEVVASYSSPPPYSGIGIFDARTGLPAFGKDSPVAVSMLSVNGYALVDMNNDLNLDIAVTGIDTTGMPIITAADYQGNQLAGWPRELPDVISWIGGYPVVADLDRNGTMEIIFSYFELDISYLYIFNSDGTAYAQLDGYPEGVAFTDNVTFGTPGVANLTGDEYPEIIFRSGHILPGSGSEQIYILDYTAQPIPGWPVETPARFFDVVSSRFAPLVDDIDNDGLVELIIVSDNTDLLVWDFDAGYDNGNNKSKLFADNLNSNIYRPAQIPTAVETGADLIPYNLNLLQNYPNPFNPTTVIEFALPYRQKVTLEIFNVLGQKVTTLVDDDLSAGRHKIQFDGSDLASGVYLYRLDTDDETLTKKMVLQK